MDQSKSLEHEIACLLDDPVFQRSPVQARLLSYLGNRTISAKGDRITQFDIATEGLGRSDYDETSDSYVRVQISRLKRTLAAYYARQQPSGDGCVYLRSGDYRLHLGSLPVAYPAQSKLKTVAELPSRALEKIARGSYAGDERDKNGEGFRRLRGPMFGAGAVFAFASMILMAALQNDSADPRATYLTLPNVAFNVETVGFGQNDPSLKELRSAAAEEARDQLTKSIVARPTDVVPESDFHLRISLDSQSSNRWQVDVELAGADGETLYLNRRDLPPDQGLAFAIIRQEMITVTSPGGMITRQLGDRLTGAPRNDFECFIAIELGKTDGVGVQQLLSDCSRRYRDSGYYPYFAARTLFAAFQAEAMVSDTFSLDSPHWSELAQLLDEFPQNPYLNTIASKALYASGKCREAEMYANEAFVRGALFPALELSILLEKIGCSDVATDRELAAVRISEIIEANPNPHALLEIWEIAAALAIERPDLAARIPTDTFNADQPVEKMSQSIIRALQERRNFKTPRLLRTMVWSPEARKNIDSAIAANAAT